MRFEDFSFGSIRIDRVTYNYDAVIDRGEIRKRKKKQSKQFREAFGHTPLSVGEKIPWKCRRLVIGTGEGALPVMPEVQREPLHDLWIHGDSGRLVPSGFSDGTACSECAASCQYRVDECKAGRMSSCYRAAQCLCQCNLDAGGCGSSREALQRCVDENKKIADEMER